MVGYDTFNAAGERLLAEEIFNANLVLLKRHALISFLCDKCEYRRQKDDKSCGSGRARASTQ